MFKIKIITLNCFLSPWSTKRKIRLPFIIKALNDEKSDIILLQEVFFETDANYIVENLLKQGYVDYFYSKTLLIVSKYPFISRSYINFKPRFNYNIFLYIAELLNRIYGKGYQIVEVKFNDQSIVIVHAHLLSVFGRDDGSYKKARLRQLVEICDYLQSLKNIKQIIFSGDFNFDFNSDSYKTVTNYYGFNDPLHEIKGDTISTTNLNRKFFLLPKMDQRIDHIFIKGFEHYKTSGKVAFQEPYIVNGQKLHISDHFGLALNLN